MSAEVVKPRVVAGVVAAYLIVLFVLFQDSLVGGFVLTQADALGLFQPWRSAMPEGFVPSNPLLLDQSIVFAPWNHFAAEQLWNGELPLWTPYNYAGTPLVGTYQSAIYWPLNWLYYLFPAWGTYVWIACAKLLLAGTFTFLFLLRLGVRAGPAAVGGLGFMLCGFMVAWLNHPQASVALFLPALLWAIEGVVARPTVRAGCVFGVLFGLQLLAGHLQTSAHIGICAGIYALVRLRVGARRLHPLGVMCLFFGASLGIVIALPQLVPFFEYLGRSQAMTVLARPDVVAGDGVQSAAIMMVAPDWYGAPHTHDYTGPEGTNLNYNELIGGYVGRVLLLLAAAQLWLGWRSRSWGLSVAFAAGVLIAALVAWQVDPVYSFVRSVPGLASTKLMRLFVIVAFGLCVLAAFGLDEIRRRFERPWLVPAVFALVGVELLWFARGYNPEVDEAALVPTTAVTEFLQRENPLHHRVLAIDSSIYKANANILHGIPTLSGYDSVEDATLTELVLRTTSSAPDIPFVSQIRHFDRIEALPLLGLLGVKYVVSAVPLPAPLTKVFEAELQVYENPRAMPKAFVAREVRVVPDREERLALLSSPSFDAGVAVLEQPVEGFVGGGSAELVSYRPRELEVEVSAPGRTLLIVNDVWAPGWHAEVDGESTPILRVDHALRGVWVEAGEHTVRMRYSPLSTWAALAMAALALIAAVAGIWRGGRSTPPGFRGARG